MEDKERKTPIDFGVKRSKVKVKVTCPQRGPLWLCQFSSFHMVCLEIKIMYEYWISFKSVRYLQEYGSFHFYLRCITVFEMPIFRQDILWHGDVCPGLCRSISPGSIHPSDCASVCPSVTVFRTLLWYIQLTFCIWLYIFDNRASLSVFNFCSFL